MRWIPRLFLLLLLPVAASAQVVTLGDGESQVFSVFGQRVITVETRPDSASQVLTFTANSVDADTYTIGSTVYTTETGTVGTALEVNDAASTALFIVNLCAAINDDGVGDGTDYFTGGAHPTVTCSASNATTLTVTATTPGSNANTIATTETTGISSWAAATLADVVDPYCTVSFVDSLAATTHTFFAERVGCSEQPPDACATESTSPDRSTLIVDAPFALVTATNGDCVVMVAP